MDRTSIRERQKVGRHIPASTNSSYSQQHVVVLTELVYHVERTRPGWRLGRIRSSAWLSGSALVSINDVTLRRARLVPGWVTVCRRVSQICLW